MWTQRAVALLAECQRGRATRATCQRRCCARGVEVTDCNAAVFDAANAFHGCIAGIHEVLRRQGLLASTRTLTGETLGPGQASELDRVRRTYPHLLDDEFVAEHLETWLRP